ncbi:MAG: M28 family peptidase [Gemmatimonadales bacterium]
MRLTRPSSLRAALGASAAIAFAAPLAAQATTAAPADTLNDPIGILVSRLNLESYKGAVKGLTQFGDRRQGTERNRKAVDWIEAQLKSYGCTNTERVTYDWQPRPPRAGGRGRGGRGADSARARTHTVIGDGPANGQGGSREFGVRTRVGVNTDSLAQPDPRIRALDTEPTTPGQRQEVYCTKVGATHPDEMYIVGGHMDGIGWGEAANDDGSGSALVMQLARVFSSPDVKTDRSIRFVLWNNEESGLDGAKAYVAQREALQGKEDPAGSGKYPEPKWLGMIQHDMMMWDHGMPRSDGTLSKEQRPEADVNIEFAQTAKMAEAAQKLAWQFKAANDKYATDYPAQVGPHMTNTDSDPFKDIVPAISLRENERGAQIGAGWDPNWHQPTDVFTTYGDKDFRLGLNAAETTLAAVAELTGATIRK